jgi:hypothetical protein
MFLFVLAAAGCSSRYTAWASVAAALTELESSKYCLAPERAVMRETSATRFHFLALLRFNTLSSMAPVHISENSSSTSSSRYLMSLMVFISGVPHRLLPDHTASISAVPSPMLGSNLSVPKSLLNALLEIQIRQSHDHRWFSELFSGSYTRAFASARTNVGWLSGYQ